MTPTVVLHPERPPGVRRELGALAAAGEIELVVADDAEAVHRALVEGADVLATYRWEPRFLQPSLRWVAGEGAGIEQYPLAELRASGVVLTTGSGVHSSAVAEHAMALLLALTRRVWESAAAVGRRSWERLPATELDGATAVVLGLGTIGEAIARRASCFGMSVVGVKRDPASYRGVVREVVAPDHLVEVCGRADVLFAVLPATPETVGIVGDAVLEALDDGWLVNVGRGNAVDQDALLRAVTAGRLRGAGLDVVPEEPLPVDSPLWELPNVALTPHIAGSTPAYGRRWVELFRRNLAAFHGSGPWVNLVGAAAVPVADGQE